METQAVSKASYWSGRYQNGSHPWDLGRETAVLAALLKNGALPPAQKNNVACSVLIPGCGFGHDALLLARAGYSVTAVDFAPEALMVLNELAAAQGLSVVTLASDVFVLPEHFSNGFDLVWEYTCYCAILPERRGEYVQTIARVLRPGGVLAALFFPLVSPSSDGPPYSVNPEAERRQFEQAGLQLQQHGVPAESHPARAGNETLMIFRKC